MVIVMLVIMTETTADLLAIGVVVGRPADRKTVANGLRADTLSTAVSGGLLNGFPVSAFAQNVGLVALTGIKSRFVVAVSGGNPAGARPVPEGRRGGGAAAAAGARRRRAGLVRHASRPAASAACRRCTTRATRTWSSSRLSIGMGVIPIAVPDFYDEFPSWFQTIFDSGISAAAVTAVLLNILFNVVGPGYPKSEAPIVAEAPAQGVTPEHQPGGHVPHEPLVDAGAAPNRQTGPSSRAE